MLGLLALLILASIWSVDYLPTHDGPQHIFSIHAANHLDTPETGWSRWLRPAFPLTSHGFELFFAPLDAWLPWPTALRATLTLMTLLWAGGAFWFVHAVRPQRSWLGVLLAGAAFQWSLYMGLFPFYAATAFGLVVLALAFGAPRWNARRRWLLAALLFLQALMHVVPAMLTGGMVTVLALVRAASGERLRELGRSALLGAPAAAVAVGLAWVGLGTLGDFNERNASEWSFALPGWWTLGKCFLAGPAWRAWPLTLLAAAAPAVALARRRGRLRNEDRALLLAGIPLLLGSALLPLDLRAWDLFSMRFLPLAVCALVATLPVEDIASVRGRRVCAAALAAFALASSGWALAYNRDLAARSRDALAGLDAPLERDGPRLPIVLDPYLGRPLDERRALVPYALPLLNLGPLYAASQGGVAAYGFIGNPHLHHVVLRAETRAAFPPAPDRKYAAELAAPGQVGDEALRGAILAYVAAHGADYQDVILWGTPEDAQHLLELGFAADWQRGGLLLARFRGCPLTVRFPAGSPVKGSTVVELGWHPAWHVTHRYALGGARREADGSLTLPLRQTPCGAVWLRFQDGGRVCEGADAEGRLLVASTTATPEVECRVQRVTATARR
jgi:hypothetical protein